jgi:hypothetical protein
VGTTPEYRCKTQVNDHVNRVGQSVWRVASGPSAGRALG